MLSLEDKFQRIRRKIIRNGSSESSTLSNNLLVNGANMGRHRRAMAGTNSVMFNNTDMVDDRLFEVGNWKKHQNQRVTKK